MLTSAVICTKFVSMHVQCFLGGALAMQAVNLLICECKVLRPKANQILFRATFYVQNAWLNNNYTTVFNLHLTRSFLILVRVALVTGLCDNWNAILSILQKSL